MYKLTILIPTLHSRIDKLKGLLSELNYQIQSKPVQILWVGDNKSMTTGEKRNLLMNSAKGQFISFIDDDDKVSENYVDIILKAIDDNSHKTVICFKGEKTNEGVKDLPFMYDISAGRNHKREIDGIRYHVMVPDHLCVWNKSHITEQFPAKNLGEDHDWARSMAFSYKEKDVVLLEDTLYYYQYDRNLTECRR